MSIDERLEALTTNLELMSHANEAYDRRFQKISDAIEKLVAEQRKTRQIFGRSRVSLQAHENRISNLE